MSTGTTGKTLADPHLGDVHGPSALGGGRRRFFDLLWLISVTEFKRVYFGTVLGYLWSLIRPLLMFGVLLLVFTQVFRVGGDKVEHYPVFLLMGIVLYTFFSEATSTAVTSVVAPAWTWLLFPVALAFLFVGAAGMSMALSALYVRFRDTQIIWVVVAQVLLYLTPILYPVNALGEETKERLLMINPLSVIFEQV